MSDEMAFVCVGFDDESEQLYVYRTTIDQESDSDARQFVRQVPSALVDRLEAAWSEVSTTVDEIAAHAGIGDDGLPVEVCAEWQGEVSPMRRLWPVVLTSVSPDEWPARDATLHTFDTEAAAREWVAALPAEVLAVPSVCPPVLVDRSRIRVAEPFSFGGWPSSCERCGRERDEHGETS